MQRITLSFPDDWHAHLRDGTYLKRTVADTCKRFERAIIMPNLSPPITTVNEALSYRQRILQAVPLGETFNPLMTLYLTKDISSETIIEGKSHISACKFYPLGATTHSQAGLAKLSDLYPIIAVMQQCDMPLLIHSECTASDVDILAREARFIEEQILPLTKEFPELRIVLEHISTKAAVDFVLSAPSNVAATITPHHLLLNLNDVLANGIRPHYYCKPIANQLSDQAALVQAAISGNPKFFLGTDSAPHTQSHKECAVGCAGIYSAHAAIELYAEVFSRHHALDKLENFASCFGAQFYHLPVNQKKLTLIQEPWQVPESLSFGAEAGIPFFAGQIINWKIHHEHPLE